MSFLIRSRGEGYTATVSVNPDGSRQFTGDMDIDYDGCPDWQTDPFGQADTSLHYEGKPLNGHEIPFIVLPPECIVEPHEIVLGCKAEVRLGKYLSPAVVGDVGPHEKLGEASPKCALNVHVDPDPNKGGTDEVIATYRYWPGVPAAIGGMKFNLLSWRDLIRGHRD